MPQNEFCTTSQQLVIRQGRPLGSKVCFGSFARRLCRRRRIIVEKGLKADVPAKTAERLNGYGFSRIVVCYVSILSPPTDFLAAWKVGLMNLRVKIYDLCCEALDTAASASAKSCSSWLLKKRQRMKPATSANAKAAQPMGAAIRWTPSPRR